MPSTLFAVAVVVVIVVAAVVGVIIGTRGNKPADRTVAGLSAVEISQNDLKGLAATRERALATGDLQSFLAPLDHGDQKLVDEQTRLFANLGKLPFAVKRYEPLGQEGRAIDRFGRGVTVQLDVAFVHQLQGYDVAPVTEWYRWTVSRKDAGSPPVITAVTGAPSGGTASKTYYYPAPWDLWPDLQVVRAGRVLFLTNQEMLATSRLYAPTAQTAAENVVAAWRGGGQRGTIIDTFVVSLLPRRQDLASLYQISTKQITGEVGFAVGVRTADQQSGSLRVGGARTVFDASADDFRPGNIGGATEIFRHEFTHAMIASLDALKHQGAYGYEPWVIEGFAEYLANRGQSTAGNRLDDARRALREGATVQLPDAFRWTLDPHVRGGAGSFHYYLGHQAMRYIAATYGEAKVFAFVGAYYRGSPTDECFRTVLGTTKAQFEHDWAIFVRHETR